MAKGEKDELMDVDRSTVFQLSLHSIGSLPWTASQFLEDRTADTLGNLAKHLFHLFSLKAQFCRTRRSF